MEPRAKWSTLGRRDRERQEMYILKGKMQMKTHICQGGLLRRSGDSKANVRECGTKWRKRGNLQILERTSVL